MYVLFLNGINYIYIIIYNRFIGFEGFFLSNLFSILGISKTMK